MGKTLVKKKKRSRRIVGPKILNVPFAGKRTLETKEGWEVFTD